ncbi:hypothetical protein BH24ACT11_BH24ACT11_04660 [soil metagenome]
MPRPGISRPGPAGRPYGSLVVAFTLAVTFLGLVIVAVDQWRVGLTIVGSAVVLASLARIVLPERNTGLLHIRRTGSDVLVMIALGATIVVLAVLVPDQPGT